MTATILDFTAIKQRLDATRRAQRQGVPLEDWRYRYEEDVGVLLEAIEKLANVPTFVRDRPYLDWLRTQPCILTGVVTHDSETVEPAHIGTGGKGFKNSDDCAVSMLHRFHSGGHQHGEVSAFREHLPDYMLRAALQAYARAQYRYWLAGLGEMP